jgi:hypothetical protein
MRNYEQAGSGWFCDYCGPGRQRHWATAGSLVKEATRAFKALGASDWSIETPSTEILAKTSIYGPALETLCAADDTARSEECTQLRTVLEDGVTPDEDDALAEAVEALNDATARDSES